MNVITINGREMSKVEFFDYVFDTFVESEREEPGSPIWGKLNVLRCLLRSNGWLDEYGQWVADGAGANEAAEELQRSLSAIPAA